MTTLTTSQVSLPMASVSDLELNVTSYLRALSDDRHVAERQMMEIAAPVKTGMLYCSNHDQAFVVKAVLRLVRPQDSVLLDARSYGVGFDTFEAAMQKFAALVSEMTKIMPNRDAECTNGFEVSIYLEDRRPVIALS
jgi:hypothetical protein